MWLTVAFAALGAATDFILLKRKPFTLEKEQERRAFLAASMVNIWLVFALVTGEHTVLMQIARCILVNGLLLMTITDLKERMVYDIHFYVLLLVGAVTAFFQPDAGFIGMYLFFLILFGVLFLVARKNDGLGMGDSRMIACLALYFPFSRWMEVMLLSLGTALLYGLIGILRKRKTLKTAIPFFPFLLIGVLIECVL